MTRLSLAALRDVAVRGAARVPAVDPRALRVGIVHLGVGAFHRAHQAVYTEDAVAATGDTRWGVHGYTQRSRAVVEQLAPQDGLYTVLERGRGAGPPRVVGVLRGIGHAPDAGPDPGPVARMADPAVEIVTLTVTEKGYRTGPGGRLDLADPVIRADLAGLAAGFARHDLGGYRPRSVVGQLVAGLRHRRDRCGAALTVLCCDNLGGNGRVLRRLVREFCDALPGGRVGTGDEALSGWIDDHVTFPSSVVDRIVPATTPADLADAGSALGVADAGTVVAEPFLQWVVEDAFAAGRPPWHAAGVVLTPDVAPYQAAKLRLLNAAHSLLAYTGALAGYATIAEAVADPVLAGAARSLMECDASPTLTVPDGFDLAGYRESILERFANRALRHTTAQVASDGSQKLPIRLLGTARERLAAGAEPSWVALAVAGWMALVARDGTGRGPGLDDPLADRLGAVVAGRTGPGGAGPAHAAGIVEALLSVREIFDEELATDPVFRALVTEHTRRLLGSSPPVS